MARGPLKVTLMLWLCALWPAPGHAQHPAGQFTVSASKVTPKLTAWGAHCQSAGEGAPEATSGPVGGRYQWRPGVGLSPEGDAPPLMGAAACAAHAAGYAFEPTSTSLEAFRCVSKSGVAAGSEARGALSWSGPDAVEVRHVYAYRWRLKGQACNLDMIHTWSLRRVSAVAAPSEATPTKEEAVVAAPASAREGSRSARRARPKPALDSASPLPPEARSERPGQGGLDVAGEASASVDVDGAARDAGSGAHSGSNLWVWLSILLAVFTALAGLWLWWRSSRQPAHVKLSRNTLDELRAAATPRGEPSPTAAPPARTVLMGNMEPVAVAPQTSERAATQPPPQVTPTANRICPNCRRHFDGESRFCPYDGHPLESPGRMDEAEEAEESRQCGHCQATWPSSVTHCPEDGTPLQHLDGGGQICPQCGARGHDGARFCPRDGTPLVTLN